MRSYTNTRQQYGGKSLSSAMSAVRCSSGSLKRSQSVTTMSVRSAIIGIASTASFSSCIVSVLPLRRW